MKSSEYIALKKKEREMINMTDEQVHELAKDIWQGKEKKDLNPPVSHVIDEDVKTYNTDTKTLALMILSVVILAFI